jgi:hypothetical protein
VADLDEDHLSVDHERGLPAEAVDVEAVRGVEVRDADGEDVESRLDARIMPEASGYSKSMIRGPLLALAILALVPAVASAQERPLATCFWEGPISTNQPSTRGFDGRNFNFPEESATYWLARFRLPSGSKLRVQGGYPHGRYMSLNAYSDGNPTDALSDTSIEPDPGAVNPFAAGNRRDGSARGWRVHVLDEPVPAVRAPNTIYARAQTGQPIELAYRVYEPDRGRDLTGDTGLPEAVLVLADGTELTGEAACRAINDADRSITVQTVPAATWRAATSCRPNHPAFDPIRWERFFNIDYATASVLADCTEAGYQARHQDDPEQRGGFYSNRDSAYIFAHLSRGFGPVVVVQGTLPVFPRTRAGQSVMAPAQLRFWSLCTGESRVTTRTPDCLADRQVAIDSKRRYTIVVSKPEDRPANAVPRCGVSWLDWGERGDGAGNPDYALLIMRNMLVSPDFGEAIQRVPRPADAEETMGPYFPRSAYSTKAGFEERGCTARKPPKLRLWVKPRRVRAGRRTTFRFKVRRRHEGADRRVAGATVRFAGRRAVTDSRGRARLTLTLERPRLYRARATKKGVRRSPARRVRALPKR